jgi:uncharacterized protein (TIGR02217 family)
VSTPVFPHDASSTKPWGRGIVWNIERTAVESTTEQKNVTGRRAAIINYPFPLFHWKCQFSVLRDLMALDRNSTKSGKYTGYQDVVGFLMGRRGKALPFFWRDPTDHHVSAQPIYVTTPAGVKDYQLLRTFGNGSNAYIQPVGGADPAGTTVIKVNGTTETGVTLNNPRDGWVHFTSAPTTGATITADPFDYVWKVVLSKDGTAVRTYAKDFWEIVDFELDEVRL